MAGGTRVHRRIRERALVEGKKKILLSKEKRSYALLVNSRCLLTEPTSL
jgi:hypothetical protein